MAGSIDTTDCSSVKRGAGYYADQFRFTATAGDQVSILADADAYGTLNDAYLYLIGPNGWVSESFYGGAGHEDARIPSSAGLVTLPLTGTYTIDVTTYFSGDTGAYALSLSGTTPCSFAPIAVGQTVTGNIDPTDCWSVERGAGYYADQFRFTATAGDQMSILADANAYGTLNDAYLYLIGPNGWVSESFYGGAGHEDARIPSSAGLITLPLTGTYTIDVTTYSSGDTGAYALSLSGTTPCSFAPIAVGQTVAGSIVTTDCWSVKRGAGYYADQFRFTATAGDQVSILADANAYGTLNDAYLYLIGPQGWFRESFYGGAGSEDARIPSSAGLITLPLTGTYTIDVTTYSSGDTGAYVLSLSGTIPQAPSAFGKISPITGATGQPTAVSLSWGASTGATSYEYCLDMVNNNNCDGSWVSTATSTSAIVSGLSGGTTYYWQVRANNGGGTIYANGSAAAYWNFSTLPPTCTSFAVTPASANPSFAAGSQVITITGLPAGCAGGSWTAIGNVSWLTVTPASGSSTGSTTVSWTQNTSTSARTGSAKVADKTFSVLQGGAAPPPSDPENDFNGDGGMDLIFRHTASGDVLLWTMNGATRVSSQMLNPPNARTNWNLVGTGDMNNDGNPDILWQEQTAGDLVAWFMDGASRVGYSYLSIPRPVDPAWKVVSVADMNGDVKVDLVWQHASTGALAAWLLDGTTVMSRVSINPSQVADANWKVVNTGDFNGDGKTDLLWKHATQGSLIVWLMDGVTRTNYAWLSPHQLLDLNWQLAATGDLNGDGKVDIVLQHLLDGRMVIWFMDGVTRTNYQMLTPDRVLDPNWRIAGPK